MQINTKQLEKIIDEEINDMETGIYLTGARVLFDCGQYQMQLVTTRDQDDFIEEYDHNDIVIKADSDSAK